MIERLKYKLTKILIAILIAGALTVLSAGSVIATPAGNSILNQATVDYIILGISRNGISNIKSNVVQEIVDLTVTTTDIANITVTSGATQQVLTFDLFNNGNGSDSYSLTNTVEPGNDFSPSSVQIYFDTNGSGTFDALDTLYTPTVNDPTLIAGASLTVFVVSDIPLGLTKGDISDIKLTVNSKSGTGSGTGDGGTEAIFGGSGGTASDISRYEVATGLLMTKSAIILDPTGGSQPLSGATVTYTITANVSGVDTLTSIVITDFVPANTSFVPSSLELNSNGLTNASDGDQGDFDVTITNGIAVYMPTLAISNGTQTIRFSVTID